MNKIYRIVWSTAHQAYVVAAETAKARGKSASTVKRTGATLVCALMAQQALATPVPDTLPTGGQVVAGQASITQSGAAMTIQQGSDKAILNWQSFNIGANASVNFQQPSSSSVALNRVLGSDPSAIYGSLTANGQVFLINPNGVLFGQGARVDVGGLVASTLNISNENFLAGTNRFTRDGATGSVVNQGELYGKYIALLAPEVRNEGVIAARQGTVALAAGEAVALNISGDRLIDVVVDRATIDTLVENRHLVQADDGTVFMSAQSANALLGQVVNSGAVEARGIVNDGGVVRLLASSTVEHSGTISVDGGTSGAGGTAILLASLSNPASLTDVSGTISARGGSEAGDGGFVETSAARVKIRDTVRIDTRAPKGSNGRWLIDPTDYTVGAAGDIDGGTLSTNLGLGDVTIDTTGAGAGNGDIFITQDITWTSGGSLTLLAYRNIEIDGATITTPFSMVDPVVNMFFGQGTSGTYTIRNGASIVDFTFGTPIVAAPDGSIFQDAWLDSSTYGDYTSEATAFVRLDAGQSSTYGGSRTINWTATVNPDGTGGALGTGTDTTGSTAWESAPSTYLTSTTAAGTANYTYNAGISDPSYYWLAGDAVAWTVNKADLTLSGSRTYDGTTTAAGSTLTATGANGETFTVTGAGDASNLASKDANATPQVLASLTNLALGTSSNGGLASNYNGISTVGSSYTIDKATLTYTADAQSMTAGDAVPALTGTVAGFVAGENQATATTGALDFTTTATPASPAASYAINGSGLNATNYTFVQAAGNATALTITAAAGGGSPAPGGVPTGGGGDDAAQKQIDIILQSLKNLRDGAEFNKELIDALLKKQGQGIEEKDKDQALAIVEFAVSEYCGPALGTCGVTNKEIIAWLGGVTPPPKATLAGTIVYKDVPYKEYDFDTASKDLSDGKAGSNSDTAKSILRGAQQKADNYRRPDFSDASDDDINFFFKAAYWSSSIVTKSDIVAYLNKTSNKGGTRSFWLEGDRIVSGPQAPAPVTRAKEPHYDIGAKTNLKPGTLVTVSLKDDNGKTQSRKARVDGQGNVKIDGAVGDMKLPLKVSISSEKPKYESDPITVGTATADANRQGNTSSITSPDVPDKAPSSKTPVVVTPIATKARTGDASTGQDTGSSQQGGEQQSAGQNDGGSQQGGEQVQSKKKVTFTIDSREYKIGDDVITADVAPYINEQGRTMLPLRTFANALGVSDSDILWNDVERSVTIFKGDRVVKVVIGEMSYTVNGRRVPMDTMAIIKNGRTFLPLRALGQALGVTVEWDEATRSVSIEQ